MLDPEVVKRLKEDHRIASTGTECWGCAGVWPCDASLLIADWERRGKALEQIEREGKSASDVWALRCASVARAALESKP